MTDSSHVRTSLRLLVNQAAFFILFGCFAAVVDYSSYRLLIALDLAPSVARASSYVAGSTTAFILNRRWAFRGNGSRAEMVRGASTYLLVFLVIVGSNWLFLHLFNGWESALPLAWFLSQAIGTTLNFFTQKLFVFRPS